MSRFPAIGTMPLFAFLFSLTALSAPPSTHDPMLDRYRQVQEALAADDLSATRAAAEALQQSAVGWMEEYPEEMANRNDVVDVVRSAGQMSKDEALPAARAHFAGASRAVVRIIRGSEELRGHWQLFYCPMVRENWVQPKGSRIDNPYMGRSMPRCGTKVKW